MIKRIIQLSLTSFCIYKIYKKAISCILNDTDFLNDILNERYKAYGFEMAKLTLAEAQRLEKAGDWKQAFEYYQYSIKILRVSLNDVLSMVIDERIKEQLIKMNEVS